MKNQIVVYSILFLTFGCSKNDALINSTGSRLVKIEYDQDDDTWMENYLYNSDGLIDQVEDFRSLGRRYEIQYFGGKLKEYSTYRIDDNKAIFRDSILYDSLGRISRIYNFSINSGPDLPLALIYEFGYDYAGKLSKRSTYFKFIEEYVRFEKYYWNGNNVQKVEQYTPNEELLYEYNYTYDDKKNYKANIPIEIKDPVNWSENNVTKMIWYDYYGNLDLICWPCETSYKYNSDEYPVEIETNWGRKLKLEYE